MRQDKTRNREAECYKIKMLRRLSDTMIDCYINGQSLKYTKIVSRYNRIFKEIKK